MVYCPQSIMESIARPAAANDEHHHQLLVQFPSLDDDDESPQQNNNNNNPPTDSEEGTVDAAAVAAAAAFSSSEASSSSSSSGGSGGGGGVGRRHEEEDYRDHHSSPSSSEESSVDATTTTPTTAVATSPCGYSDKLLLLPIPNLSGESDPASIIKTYLNDLVNLLKEDDHSNTNMNDQEEEERSGGGEKKKNSNKRRKVEQQQRRRHGEDDEEEKKEPATTATTSNDDNVFTKNGVSSNNSNNNSETSLQGEEEKKKLSKEPIDTIMHWMESFQDDETIQLICLQSLPTILEDPTLRRIAQSDGLASIVLYDMAAFPSNSLLILTAFHTLVVLLRPLGTNEGMVHRASSVVMSSTSSKGIRSIRKNHSGGGGGGGAATASSSLTNSITEATTAINSVNFKGDSSGTPSSSSSSSSSHKTLSRHQQYSSNKQRSNSTASSSSFSVTSNTQLYDPSMKNQLTNWEENGVRVMLDSLRRFSNDRYLQAMGCWAMVNAALYPSLKSSLTRLGGVYTVTNAMMLHPNAEAVQFRGLFALINLVIPERDNNERSSSSSSIHSHVYQIARLTILAMKNFHTNKSILNRGCLVLRNLSLTPSFVKILSRTPGCVDMLLHCRQICPRDVLVQRSARTIMVMIQRASEKEQLTNNAHDRHSFTLTQPFPVPSRGGESGNRSSSPASTLSSGVSQQKR